MESLAFFHQGSAAGVHVVRVRGEVFRSGSRLLLTNNCDFCLRDPKVPSSHCSHIRRMLLEERSLLGLPHHSRRRTSFWRHVRSVEALVSLCVDTSDKATKRQRAQASSVAFGMCVRSGFWVEKTSCRLGVSGWRGRSMNSRWGPGMDSIWGNTMSEMRREHTRQIWRELSIGRWLVT